MGLSVTPIDRSLEPAWDAFIARHPLGTAFGSSTSRSLWAARGWDLHLVGLTEGGQLRAGAAVVTKRIPKLPFAIARAEAFMPDPADLPGTTPALIAAAEDTVRRAGGIRLAIPLRIFEGLSLGGIEYAGPVTSALRGRRYQDSTLRITTYLADLERDDEALMESFTSKCRRDARKGLREGVEVTRLTTAAELDEFCVRQLEMSQRKGCGIDKAYTSATLAPMLEAGHMLLFGARHNGTLCNMALVDGLGIPRYTLGASAPAAFEKGVPPTGQPLHYEIMRYLRDQGKTHYDLGGVPGPEPVEGHSSFTVWRFKREFGAPFVSSVPLVSRVLTLPGRLIIWAATKSGRFHD